MQSQGVKKEGFLHLFIKSERDLILVIKHNICPTFKEKVEDLSFFWKDIHPYKVPSKHQEIFPSALCYINNRQYWYSKCNLIATIEAFSK